jgi:hypothetical protein
LFAPADLEKPGPSRPQMPQERVIGLAILVFFVFICLALSLTMDAQVFNPYNTAHPITQTWQAQTTRTPGSGAPPFSAPRRPTITPRNADRAVRYINAAPEIGEHLQ